MNVHRGRIQGYIQNLQTRPDDLDNMCKAALTEYEGGIDKMSQAVGGDDARSMISALNKMMISLAPGKATGSIVGGLRPTDRTQSSELPSTACAEKRVHGPHGVPLGISKALRQASLVNDIPLAHQAACNLRNSSGTDGDLGCTWHGCTY
eukprot:900064-Rhodomonas_salina.1